MRKRCDIPHSASHFQKSLIIASWLLTFLFTGTAFAQENRTITGIVRDVTGEPLIGASVIQKGTNNGVITDVDGNFTLTVPADATLSIAYMGYATREINLAKRKKQGDLKITLSEDTQQLKEVVVTAMGIKKDTKRVGYAISTISADELVKAGAPNFASAMYGKAPGVRITQTQGGSAGAVSINVRGLTSITGNNQPLIILDGVPIRNGGTGKSTDFAEFGNDGQIRSNGLVDINPEDIESLSILKGASATALYGSEAANGAVVITSKRAKSGKLTVDFNAQVMANLPAYLPKVQTVYGPGTYNTAYSDYEKQTGGFYQRTLNGQSYKSLLRPEMRRQRGTLLGREDAPLPGTDRQPVERVVSHRLDPDLQSRHLTRDGNHQQPLLLHIHGRDSQCPDRKLHQTQLQADRFVSTGETAETGILP